MKKIISILLLITLFTTFNINAVSADYAQSENKINDVNIINDMFNDFLKENNLPATVCIDDTSNLDESGNPYSVVLIVGAYSDDKTVEIVSSNFNSFIAENNIDSNYTKFLYLDIITPYGDANGDSQVTVRDCAFIASKLASNEEYNFYYLADFNNDNVVNVRDAAAIAKILAK